jgi:hypothetical protein
MQVGRSVATWGGSTERVEACFLRREYHLAGKNPQK